MKRGRKKTNKRVNPVKIIIILILVLLIILLILGILYFNKKPAAYLQEGLLNSVGEFFSMKWLFNAEQPFLEELPKDKRAEPGKFAIQSDAGNDCINSYGANICYCDGRQDYPKVDDGYCDLACISATPRGGPFYDCSSSFPKCGCAVICSDDSGCNVGMGKCISGKCTSNQCIFENLPSETPCSMTGASGPLDGKCDGNGVCSGCVNDIDCGENGFGPKYCSNNDVVHNILKCYYGFCYDVSVPPTPMIYDVCEQYAPDITNTCIDGKCVLNGICASNQMKIFELGTPTLEQDSALYYDDSSSCTVTDLSKCNRNKDCFQFADACTDAGKCIYSSNRGAACGQGTCSSKCVCETTEGCLSDKDCKDCEICDKGEFTLSSKIYDSSSSYQFARNAIKGKAINNLLFNVGVNYNGYTGKVSYKIMADSPSVSFNESTEFELDNNAKKDMGFSVTPVTQQVIKLQSYSNLPGKTQHVKNMYFYVLNVLDSENIKQRGVCISAPEKYTTKCNDNKGYCNLNGICEESCGDPCKSS